MDDRRVTLPDLKSVKAAKIVGYSLEADGHTVRLWIDAYEDSQGPVRVFTSESVKEVAVLVVPTPPKYKLGLVGDPGDCTDEDIAADVADVIARLDAPLGTRRLRDARSKSVVEPLPQWILDRKTRDPAPRLRPIGTQDDNDPLTFRGEL